MFKRRNKNGINPSVSLVSGKKNRKNKKRGTSIGAAETSGTTEQTSMLSHRNEARATPINVHNSSFAEALSPNLDVPQQDMAPVLQHTTAEKEHFFASIENGDWNFVRRKLKSRMGKKICLWKDNSNLSLLGMVLGSRAPIDIIEHVIKLNPDAVLSKDVFGAMPLHLGCLNGISPQVVETIFDIDGGHSARVLDQDNRTALHHAVEYACLLPRNEDSSLISIVCEQSIETIELILSVAPETVHYMTLRGDTPLDIPHEIKMKRNDVDDTHIEEVYRILKATSIEVYQSQKQKWEANGYDTTEGQKHNSKFENNSVPSLLSSQASSAARNSKAALYEELEQMSIHSAAQLSM